MSLIVLKFTPGAPQPEVTVLKESLDQVRAAIGNGLTAKTIRVGHYRMVLLAENNAEACGRPVNRIYDGSPIYGTFLLCGDGKGASIVSIPLQLLGYMKHTAAEVFRLPEQAHAQPC